MTGTDLRDNLIVYHFRAAHPGDAVKRVNALAENPDMQPILTLAGKLGLASRGFTIAAAAHIEKPTTACSMIHRGCGVSREEESKLCYVHQAVRGHLSPLELPDVYVVYKNAAVSILSDPPELVAVYRVDGGLQLATLQDLLDLAGPSGGR
jgi:hypothetical protein